MLERLSIRHYALIEDAEIFLADGLTVLTGETGAGKSIIMGALSLLLGDKANSDVIRTGYEYATVSGTFHFDNVPELLKDELEAMEIDLDEGDLVVSRTIRRGGRSSSSIQGSARTRLELEKLGRLLVDVSAQRDHQSLFSPSRQLKVLDDASNDEKELCAYQESWYAYQSLKVSHEELSRLVQESKRERDYLEYAVNEIEKIRLRPGEDEEITRQLAIASQYEQIHDHVSQGVRLLGADGEGSGALEALRGATKQASKAAQSDGSLATLASRLESAAIEVQDIYETLRDYLEHMSYSQEKLEKMQSRQSYLQRLKKKYGPSLDDVITFHAQAREKLEAGEHGQERLLELERQIKNSQTELSLRAKQLSAARKKSALQLEKEVENVLHDLGMAQATFSIKVQPCPLASTGSDVVSFEICANPGLEERPISQVASGGELSRILLALTAVLQAGGVPGTLVFDEIDSGIGGAVAVAVGRELSRLKKSHQVLAITHLASVAAMADTHYVVSKRVEDGLSYTSLAKVEGEEREKEIARMLTGDTGEITLMHAKSLLKSSAP